MKHVPVEGCPSESPELCCDRFLCLPGVIVDTDRHMRDQRRRVAIGPFGTALHSRQGDVPQVRPWTHPADGAIGFSPAHLERTFPKSCSHHWHVDCRHVGVGFVIAPGVVHRSLLEQRLEDVHILPEMCQRRPEVDSQGLFDPSLAAGAQAQPEPAGSQLGEGQDLLGDGDGVSREGFE